MGNSEKNKRFNQRMYYVDGSSARQLDTVSQPSPTRENEIIKRQKLRKRVKRQKRFLGYKITLMMCMFATLVGGVVLVGAETQVRNKSREIQKLENELNEIVNLNNVLIAESEKAIDLDEIYTIATNELGMVEPSEDQVRYYERDEKSYVEQYAQIPNESSKSEGITSLADFILGYGD